MDFLSMPDSWAGRVFFERGTAAIFLVAFLVARNQFPALLGENGLLPVPDYLRGKNFWEVPSVFHWRFSDRFFEVIAWTGIVLSGAILAGALKEAPVGVPVVTWLVLTFLYLSIGNVGQRFYSFGWESMLVEAGFFAAFLSPQWMIPSLIPVLLLKWMLFRVEVGAGLIKLRAGGPWKDLTALMYHHETQPMPNPLSRIAHRLPQSILKGGVVFSHFVQVGAPFALFLPQPVAGIAGLLIIAHQGVLILFGNYSWLNWLTVILAFATLPNAWLTGATGAPTELASRPMAWEITQIMLLVVVAWLSVEPFKNLLSKRQLMNYSWNNWKLVNAYGAFGSVTKVRHELVIEGTSDDSLSTESKWLEYEFKGKPGNPSRRPPQIAPYHLRLDWLMWFLPLAVRVTDGGVSVMRREVWFERFVQKLLENDEPTLKLMKHNPFPDQPPQFIRVRFYRYTFTDPKSGQFWDRELVGEYLQPTRRE